MAWWMGHSKCVSVCHGTNSPCITCHATRTYSERGERKAASFGRSHDCVGAEQEAHNTDDQQDAYTHAEVHLGLQHIHTRSVSHPTTTAHQAQAPTWHAKAMRPSDTTATAASM